MESARALFGILFVAALLVSCGEESPKSRSDDAVDHSTHLADSPNDEFVGLSLNKGQRWKMDDHTRVVFSEMADFFLGIDQSGAGEEALRKAGEDLQVLTNKLIQGCTMAGAAHDQLHVYLSGYIPAVAALSESGRTDDAEAVRRYLEMYDKYFE